MLSLRLSLSFLGFFFSGCDVINLSLGGPGNSTTKADAQSAVDYATSTGAIVIAASGNSATNFVDEEDDYRVFPGLENALAINACAPTGWGLNPLSTDWYKLADYSNNGLESEFCAPGGRFNQSFQGANSTCAFGISPCYLLDGVVAAGSQNSYYFSIGTSMAAPYASGVAALIISENLCKFKGKPLAVAAEMRKRAADKGEPGLDGLFGYGFVQSGYNATSAQVNTTATSTCGLDGSPSAQGDPHFKTWRGDRYDFHGECDLVLLHSSEFESGLGLDVHIRTKMRRDMSYISAAVLRMGTDVLEVQSGGVYYLNGVAGAELPDEFAGFAFSHTQPTEKQHVFEIYFGGRERFKLKTYKDLVSVLIEQGHSKHFGDSVGLMGDFKYGAKLSRDGETVIDDANTFGQEWQVRDTEASLFQHARLPQYPKECTLPPPIQVSQLRRRLLESSIDTLAAEKACAHWGEGKADCVFDVLTTDDLEMAVVGAY
jgi:hypothetical protein